MYFILRQQRNISCEFHAFEGCVSLSSYAWFSEKLIFSWRQAFFKARKRNIFFSASSSSMLLLSVRFSLRYLKYSQIHFVNSSAKFITVCPRGISGLWSHQFFIIITAVESRPSWVRFRHRRLHRCRRFENESSSDHAEASGIRRMDEMQ